MTRSNPRSHHWKNRGKPGSAEDHSASPGTRQNAAVSAADWNVIIGDLVRTFSRLSGATVMPSSVTFGVHVRDAD